MCVCVYIYIYTYIYIYIYIYMGRAPLCQLRLDGGVHEARSLLRCGVWHPWRVVEGELRRRAQHASLVRQKDRDRLPAARPEGGQGG